MEIHEYGIEEFWTPKTIFMAFFGVRTVRATSKYGNYKIVILGVPPWRALRTKDLYEKRCYEVK